MLSNQYLLILCLMVTKLATLVDFREKIIPICFRGHKVKSNYRYWSSYQHCLLNTLWTIYFIINKLGTVVANREWIVRPPFEKRGKIVLHIVTGLHLSVGLSFGQSVDLAMSAWEDIFRLYDQSYRSNCWFLSQVLSTRYIMILCLMVTKLCNTGWL